jgi:hypothetical protein
MKAWAFVVVGLAGCGLAGCGLAGCFDNPPFRGGDDPDAGSPACTGDGPLSTGTDGQGRRVVCGPGYTMRVSERGYGFPDSFTVGGVELLAHGDTCEDEDGLGLGFYPAGILAGVDPPADQDVEDGRTVTVDVETPFLVKLAIPWRASFGPCALAPHGRTTFTFFPDGRIFRQDHVLDTSAASATACPGACGEATANEWHLTSFTTLAVTPGQSITPEPRPADDDHGAGNALAQHTSCVAGDDYALALHWYEALPRRLRVPAPGTSAFVQELLPATPATVPATLDAYLHTDLLVRAPRADCPALRTALESHGAGNPQLTLDGVNLDEAHDGIYGGENDQGSAGYPVGNTVTLTGGGPVPVAAGWAVWLRFPALARHFDVHRDGGDPAGEWYLVSEPLGATTGVIVWFRDALAVGQTITIIASE